MDIPIIRLPFNIPVNNAVRYIVLEQIIQGLVYSLQQIPKQIHELRKWAEDTSVADQAFMEKYGKRPPRTLARRHGLDFIHRYDALLTNIKEYILPNYLIHNICIILGPNYHNPKYSIYISFPSSSSSFTTENNQKGNAFIPPMVLPIRYPPSVKQLLFPTDETSSATVLSVSSNTVSINGTALSSSSTNPNSSASSSSSSSSTSSRFPSLSTITTPLTPDIATAVARKTARLLVLESANLYGLRSVRPSKLIILLNTSPLPQSTTTTTLSTTTDNSIRTMNNDDTNDLSTSMMPPGWHLRPTFSLRPPKHCHVRTTKISEKITESSSFQNDENGGVSSSSSSSSSSSEMELTDHQYYQSSVTDNSVNEIPSSSIPDDKSSNRFIPPMQRQRKILYGKEIYRLIHIQVEDNSSSSSTDSVTATTADTVADTIEPQWWQWTSAPCGFRSTVPPPVKLEKRTTRKF